MINQIDKKAKIKNINLNKGMHTGRLSVDCYISNDYSSYQTIAQEVPLGGFCDKNIEQISTNSNLTISNLLIGETGSLLTQNIIFQFCNKDQCSKFHECYNMRIAESDKFFLALSNNVFDHLL